MTATFGFIQTQVTGSSPRTTAERLQASARTYGAPVLEHTFVQPRSPVDDLWALVQACDQESGGQVLERLRQLARRHGIDLQRLLDSAPPTPALWTMLDRLASAESGYLLVPSPQHFDHLGVPRTTLLRLIARVAPQVRVVFLDSHSDREQRGVIARVDVPAAELAVEIVDLTVRERLARAGLGHVVASVLGVLHELVGDAIRATTASVGDLGRIHVKVLRPAGTPTVSVQFFETRDHADEPVSETVWRMCNPTAGGHVRRLRRAEGGTVTLCELPLQMPYPDPPVSGVGEPGHQHAVAETRPSRSGWTRPLTGER
ncbi:hypothetical protein AB0M34_11890 [Nocardia sp. NPDC050193]